MCRNLDDGGQRCAAHTRLALARARERHRLSPGPDADDALQAALAAHASTPAGADELRSVLADAGDSPEAVDLQAALRRGMSLRARNRLAGGPAPTGLSPEEQEWAARMEAELDAPYANMPPAAVDCLGADLPYCPASGVATLCEYPPETQQDQADGAAADPQTPTAVRPVPAPSVAKNTGSGPGRASWRGARRPSFASQAKSGYVVSDGVIWRKIPGQDWTAHTGTPGENDHREWALARRPRDHDGPAGWYLNADDGRPAQHVGNTFDDAIVGASAAANRP